MIFNYAYWKLKTSIMFVIVSLVVPISDANANDRVFIDDLEGIWFERSYLDILRETKQPHEAEKKSKPVLIAIKKEGRVFPYFATDMVKATLMIVFDVEPGEDPDTYRLVLGERNVPTSAEDVVYVWFKGQKSADGQFRQLQIQEPLIMDGQWAYYERVGKELGPIINNIVLSGEYFDKGGNEWVFTDEGKATFPNESAFYYEVSLIRDGATCDYIEAEDLQSSTGIAYYGFSWTDSGTVEIFNANLEAERVVCQPEPFAELTPM